jgi:hypothetical protein
MLAGQPSSNWTSVIALEHKYSTWRSRTQYLLCSIYAPDYRLCTWIGVAPAWLAKPQDVADGSECRRLFCLNQSCGLIQLRWLRTDTTTSRICRTTVRSCKNINEKLQLPAVWYSVAELAKVRTLFLICSLPHKASAYPCASTTPVVCGPDTRFLQTVPGIPADHALRFRASRQVFFYLKVCGRLSALGIFLGSLRTF